MKNIERIIKKTVIVQIGRGGYVTINNLMRTPNGCFIKINPNSEFTVKIFMNESNRTIDCTLCYKGVELKTEYLDYYQNYDEDQESHICEYIQDNYIELSTYLDILYGEEAKK